MLAPAHRLRKETDIRTLFSKGKGAFDPTCGVKFRANGLDVSRFAVVVGSAVSKEAVMRNRVRRRLREIVRARLPRIKPGFDVALMARPPAARASFAALEAAVERSLRKAGLLV